MCLGSRTAFQGVTLLTYPSKFPRNLSEYYRNITVKLQRTSSATELPYTLINLLQEAYHLKDFILY